MPCPPLPKTPTPARLFAKGSMYWHDFRGKIGVRPALIISRDRPGSNDVTVAMVTDAANVLDADGRLRYPYQALVRVEDCPGLDCDSVVKLDRIWTINRQWLNHEWYIGTIGQDALARVDAALLYAFDLQPFVADFVRQAVNATMTARNEGFARR